MVPSMNEVYEYILSIQKGLGGGKYGYLLIMIDGWKLYEVAKVRD